MNVHRIFLIATLLLAACLPTPASDTTGSSSSSSSTLSSSPADNDTVEEGENEDEDDDDAALSESSGESARVASSRVIEITADNWSFTPNAITVKKGEKVTLRIKGAAGIHGFAIADLGINVRAEAGNSVDVVLPTDTAGTFSFFCSVPCGPGHKDMKGTITITE